ncbi:hypothetical protein [Maribacter sp. 2304DJ31-5]|uniref:hypothetical protein n=1 Tax=Maribacter sp. 2304DJ31-5 TaxID=3386273 RepID=UPI0039BC89B3
MNGLEKAKLKDKILNFAIVKKSQWEVEELWEDKFKHGYSIRHIESIVEEILIELPEVLDKYPQPGSKNYYLKSSPKDFLDWGGFVSLYEVSQIENKDVYDKIKLEDEIRKLQKISLEQKTKTHYLPIVISIISLGFAAYSLLKPFDSVPQEQYDIKMKSIKKELKQIKVDFKQKNDELKDRLSKAEMLIAVYESDSTN